MTELIRRKIFALLSELGVEDRKPFVLKFSQKRTESLSQLDELEAGKMISHLEMEKKKRNNQRRYILSLGYQLGWIVKSAPADFSKFIDFGVSKLKWEKKEFQFYTSKQLTKLISVLENILEKDVKKEANGNERH